MNKNYNVVSIIQSNYIPWRGYFDFIKSSDLFVVYDDMQYTKHDWRNRNKIKTEKGLDWVSIPVIFSLKNPTSICETPINYSSGWVRDHLNRIHISYRTAPYFTKYFSEFEDILNKEYRSISELNVTLIKWLSRCLEITTPVMLSTEIEVHGEKTDRVIDVLKKVGARKYISGPSAKNYLEESKFLENGIELEYKTYNYQPYPQLFGDFKGDVTVLDLLFNCGPESRNFLISN